MKRRMRTALAALLLALALPAGGSFVTKMDNSATNIVLTFTPTPTLGGPRANR